MADFYWVGAGIIWDDPNGWSDATGGSGGVVGVPQAGDVVYFDGNSGQLNDGPELSLSLTSLFVLPEFASTLGSLHNLVISTTIEMASGNFDGLYSGTAVGTFTGTSQNSSPMGLGYGIFRDTALNSGPCSTGIFHDDSINQAAVDVGEMYDNAQNQNIISDLTIEGTVVGDKITPPHDASYYATWTVLRISGIPRASGGGGPLGGPGLSI